MRPPRLARVAVVALGAAAVARAAAACAVCYGQGDPAQSAAVNQAILFLLGVVAVVQAGFVALFWSIHRRGRARQRRKAELQVIEGGAR